MDSSNNVAPERQQSPRADYPSMAPNLGGMAANMAPTVPEIAPRMPEIGSMTGQEMLPSPEMQVGPGTSSVQPLAPLPVTPQIPISQPVTSDAAATNTATVTAPASAADDDLIEKEWVDQAKKLINTTKDNPHEQAKLVAELMRDYVRKRYGKEVGRAPDDI